jgi:hypothetical protein
MKSLRKNMRSRESREAILMSLEEQEQWQTVYESTPTYFDHAKTTAAIITGLTLASIALYFAFTWGQAALDPQFFSDREYWQSMPFLRTAMMAIAALVSGYLSLRFLYSYYVNPRVSIGKIQQLRYQSTYPAGRHLAVRINDEVFMIPKDRMSFLWTGWLVRITSRRFTKEVIRVELEDRPPEYVPPHLSSKKNH